MTTLTLEPRFNGPPSSGHGGYSCGRVAQLLGADRNAVVEVTLRAPPPLGVPMDVVVDGAVASVLHDGALVATARLDATVLQVPPRVRFEDASAVAAPNAPHPFPTCFACGPERGDGLRLFTQAIPGAGVAAAAFVPDGSLPSANGAIDDAIVWAALDCPSGWAFDALDSPLRTNVESPALLGRMTTQVFHSVAPDEPCVVVAKPAGGSGRKLVGISAVYDGEGALAAVSRVVWITPRQPQ